MMNDLKAIFIRNLKEFRLKNPVFIIGFPNVGLVGSIATTYLSKLFDFSFVGTFKSSKLAPIAAIHDYEVLPPIRIMASKKHNIVLITSESSIPISLSQSMADLILELFKELNGSILITLGGITLGEDKNAVYFIPSTKKAKQLAISKRVGKVIKDGATTGVSALILIYSSLKNIDALTLLAEANPDFGDPKASSNVLKSLSKLLNIHIDTSLLDKEAKDLSTITESELKSRSFNSSMYR